MPGTCSECIEIRHGHLLCWWRHYRGAPAIPAGPSSLGTPCQINTYWPDAQDALTILRINPRMSATTDRVLAKPTGLCCLKGSIHSGQPQGKTERIDGVETYIATPDPKTANGNVLLFFPDAFGLYVNSYLMMDAFASYGYLTLGVDYFLGVQQKPILLQSCRWLTKL